MAIRARGSRAKGAYANDPVNRRLLAADSIAYYLLGVPLLVAPRRSTRLLGVPEGSERLYPQVLGGVLTGIATALIIERSRGPNAPVGLGVPGAIAINAAGGAAVALRLRTDADRALPKRGRIVLRTVAAAVLGIGAVEAASQWYQGGHRNKRRRVPQR